MSMDAPALINFFKGHPSYRLLPNAAVVKATTELLTPTERDYDSETINRHPLTYGSDEGAFWVRDTICQFNNGKAFKFPNGSPYRSKPEYLNLNSGASYGVLSILLQTTLPHTGYTRQAFIISPTYFLINDCFIDAGFGGKLTAVSEEGEDSIDFDFLEERLAHFESEARRNDGDVGNDTSCVTNPTKNPNKKVYRYVLYCVPTYANPSGMSFSLETKKKLLDLARKYDMLIIADDVYDLLNYEQPLDTIPTPPMRIVHLDRSTNTDSESFGNSISNATFSKIIAPGLRFGYHETINSKLAHQLSEGGANTSGGTPSQLNSMIVGTLLKEGTISEILYTLRSVYKVRATILYDSIKKFLPRATKCEMIKGGYFVWVTLPEGYDAAEIGNILNKKHQVVMANGSNFEVIGDEKNWGQSSVRLSISFLEVSQIVDGIQLWGEVCKDFAQLHVLTF
ncbi:2-aminoadipate transaminase KNAG_0G01680 [Huiozyma naganishii CBS 8797]|uniref:Aminotransferase class I/classII large domain-containing protein n=1 Tax=Huiozyma naganishii (strain ATCC MYA-139 / BCRC 22969 / CBS 8797 / KCTC 17520 / NBRC 10181 / NCYC 3082 / Yp74L-3) TaxID=1071383 RepID=J7S910_HUIN7|nr:hypothetical protein KNAG_0G01680 [Kazachstania naganishii CBS 8797]CCK71226.1 hypothetical protein KNAG_0G01680 [Kazachstania naganishii CBS 8797]